MMIELILKIALPIVSIVIACVSIYFTWQQSKSNKRHNELSVKPAICSNFDAHSKMLTFKVINKGLGPAKVDQFQFFFENKLISFNDALEVINKKYRHFCKHEEPPLISTQSQGSYIAKDEVITILKLVFNDETTPEEKALIESEIESNFALEFEYTSFYEDIIKKKFKFSSKP